MLIAFLFWTTDELQYVLSFVYVVFTSLITLEWPDTLIGSTTSVEGFSGGNYSSGALSQSPSGFSNFFLDSTRSRLRLGPVLASTFGFIFIFLTRFSDYYFFKLP